MSTIEKTSRRRQEDYRREKNASSDRGKRKKKFSLLSIGKGIDIPFILIILGLLATTATITSSVSCSSQSSALLSCLRYRMSTIITTTNSR